ncbi:MAG TPA: AAA family ATPase [Ideonella sp.]|uniref:ATP-dependent nuclease n=1 Tax=Ideonella sp. TaxID=1929293 RepID=UPI002CEA5533|nr:AAA family ATPase [Ideonella sp.]HSI49181.1 AAA family ATPase [Ideonella sp.]
MARIRKVEIRNFRSIRSLDWCPTEGVNCLIGPGDSGKSTILDAIDLCLAARRNLAVVDTDFFGLDVTQDICITLTLGALPGALKNIDAYGEYLRGFDGSTGSVEDEPRKGLETVLTLRLTVKADLEPLWALYSDRTAAVEPTRGLAWKDRMALAPARLGNHPNSNLSWTRGSVLNRLSDERADVGSELVRAAREARAGFGAKAAPQLAGTLKTVTQTAHGLGVPVGTSATALLDAHSVSFGDGAISLHSESGIPLRSLGTGSSRLLIAGLHRAAAEAASIVLVDEIEFGLEPHRLTRLLGSLGSKEKAPPLQVFMTTHSPVVLRELSGAQLFVVRATGGIHGVLQVGTGDDVQSTIRSYPEAFLARTVVVCEGASEVGLIRGLDDYWTAQGYASLQAAGVSYVDTGGGDADRCFHRAEAFQKLGYRVATVQDNDKTPTPAVVAKFVAAGGYSVAWRGGRALEDELFMSFPPPVVSALIDRALELTEDGLVDQHIKTKSVGKANLAMVLQDGKDVGFSVAARQLLGEASRIRKAGWFKSITKMEGVARDFLGPHFEASDPGFRDVVRNLFGWAYAHA